MTMPTVITEFKDTANRVLWKIRAYRTVTQQEALMAIAAYQRQRGMPKPNTSIEVITVIGSTE